MSLRKVLSLTGLATAGLVLLTDPASAHVGPSVHSAPAGSYLTFSLQVPHGCGDGGTTRLEVQIPDDIASVTPGAVPGWTVTRTQTTLDTPVDDGKGATITERTSAITWAGGPLAHDQLLLFPLSVKLPESGDQVRFPTIQSCDNGEQTEWIQPTVEGQDDPDHPAPVIELTAAAGDGHGSSTTVTIEAHESDDTGNDNDNGDEDDRARPLAATGVALGAVGIVLGAVALKRSAKGS